MNAALQNRDLLRSIGEYEEYQPVEARFVRELRGIFECLSGNGYQLIPPPTTEPPGLQYAFGVPAGKVIRTEKVGSGGYCNFVQRPLKSGFPHVDAYVEARKTVAFGSVDHYYRRVKQERKRAAEKFQEIIDSADAAAGVWTTPWRWRWRRERQMSIEDCQRGCHFNDDISRYYRKACVAAYSGVVSSGVDKSMDSIETVFLKKGQIRVTSASKDQPALRVRSGVPAAAAAAAAAAVVYECWMEFECW